METHEQYLSMAGIMYGSIKDNWKKSGREKNHKGNAAKNNRNTV